MLLLILQIAFPILLLASVVAVWHVLHLFEVLPKLSYMSGPIALLGGSVGVLGLLFYLYTGLRIEDPRTLSVVRQFFVVNILDDTVVLSVICTLLACVLAFVLWLGIRSETLVLVVDSSVEGTVEVHEVDGSGEAHRLGVTSSDKPLRRRFRSGNHRIRPSLEGFGHDVPDVRVGNSIRNLLPGKERMVRLELRAEPSFELHDFYTDEPAWLPPEGLDIPARLGQAANTLVFTLGSPSPTPFRVQDLYLRVVDFEPLEQSTFPYYGEGAPEPPPILGFVELKPRRGRYKVRTRGGLRSRLGREEGLSDFHVLVFCERGYRYRVRLEVDWIDIAHPQRKGEHSFEETEAQIGFPELVAHWQDFVRDSREVKILFYPMLEGLVDELRSIDPVPSYTLLVVSQFLGEGHHDEGFPHTTSGQPIEQFEHAAWIPVADQVILKDLVGSVELGRLRNFLLIDGQTLLLQDRKELDRAEIIKNEERIAAIEEAYDSLAEQLIGDPEATREDPDRP